MKDNFLKKLFSDRYILISIIFIAASVLIGYKLFQLQVVKGEYYYESSKYKIYLEKTIDAPRGNIYDRNGVPIAITRKGYRVNIVNARLNDQELNGMLLQLAMLFEANGDNFNDSLSRYLDFDTFSFGTEARRSGEKFSEWIKANNIDVKFGFLDNNTGFVDYENERNVLTFFNALKAKYKIADSYSPREASSIMKMRYEIREFSSYNPLLIATEVSEGTVAQIEERSHFFKGVTVDIEYYREYMDAYYAAHVIGYVRGIDAESYSRLKSEGYGINDTIGKSGVEYSAEKYLRGQNGLRKIEYDLRGRQSTVIEEIPAVAGNDIILTLDMELQKIAMDVLDRTIKEIREKEGPLHFHDAFAGSLVALDVNNGETLALVNFPGYDPAIFLAGPGDREAQQAIMDLSDPDKNHLTSEFNRAISGRYAPGSTLKPAVGLAALETGVIGRDTTINDVGQVTYDGMVFTCMDYRHGRGSHGPISITRALAASCNVFFYEAGVMTGIDNIDKWIEKLGLGVRTGIEIPGEIEGIRSNRAYKSTISPYPWGKADTASSSIGQLYHEYTPLQLANYTAIIANGGKKYNPHVIRYIADSQGKIVMETPIEYEELGASEGNVLAIQQGMIAVANEEDGTAVNVFRDLPYKVGAKTGTAESFREGESNNGVFICYAPAEIDKTPQIAVAIVIERGIYGMYAAPVAREIITEYLSYDNPDESKIHIVPTFIP